MRIENDIKLDYKDVLFRPKRSTLHSREEVDFLILTQLISSYTESEKKMTNLYIKRFY